MIPLYPLSDFSFRFCRRLNLQNPKVKADSGNNRIMDALSQESHHSKFCKQALSTSCLEALPYNPQTFTSMSFSSRFFRVCMPDGCGYSCNDASLILLYPLSDFPVRSCSRINLQNPTVRADSGSNKNMYLSSCCDHEAC